MGSETDGVRFLERPELSVKVVRKLRKHCSGKSGKVQDMAGIMGMWWLEKRDALNR